ncbi:tRNA lysidine(34) synthetase TilS [Seohaeicola saemankumensis]|uniref:tRNA lysidine(34) synthetase TilS n=1 Tax=Seohaeicola saemankumensis TaxID=481181 RepID=UPI001E3742C9|nr:tRNA lysidine(34) synthetase TilS [Seohaeicola saemankumensis]MCD1625941.1 tRNA lysidine(34) synthetase TilS [Seohaeicola saemankumensis]
MTQQAVAAQGLALRAVTAALQGNDRVGIAVSGGGDSMALLCLAQQAAAPLGCKLAVATVDHGLRAGSASEAADVARYCAAQGLPHDTLLWEHGPVCGNLQAAARDARYGLLAAWARAREIPTVLLGHTLDDQAETFLMRLGREAGLDGLSGMARQFARNGVQWHRPLLDTTRAKLRDTLISAGLGWSDDPSNEDHRFDRIKARTALQALGPLGIDAAGLGRVMSQLQDARDALRHAVHRVAVQAIRQDYGALVIDWPALEAEPPEILRRCMVSALVWVSGAPYPSRREDLALVIAAMADEGQKTLSGCIVKRQGQAVRIMREHRAVRDLVTRTDAIWDHHWRLDGPHASALHIGALGEAGLRNCPDWRATGLPRAMLLASPAIWEDQRLVAAPLAGHGTEWTARIVADFHDMPVSH